MTHQDPADAATMLPGIDENIVDFIEAQAGGTDDTLILDRHEDPALGSQLADFLRRVERDHEIDYLARIKAAVDREQVPAYQFGNAPGVGNIEFSYLHQRHNMLYFPDGCIKLFADCKTGNVHD